MRILNAAYFVCRGKPVTINGGEAGGEYDVSRGKPVTINGGEAGGWGEVEFYPFETEPV